MNQIETAVPYMIQLAKHEKHEVRHIYTHINRVYGTAKGDIKLHV